MNREGEKELLKSGIERERTNEERKNEEKKLES